MLLRAVYTVRRAARRAVRRAVRRADRQAVRRALQDGHHGLFTRLGWWPSWSARRTS